MNNTSACLITGILLSSLIFVGEGRGRASYSKMDQHIDKRVVSIKKWQGQMMHSKSGNATICSPVPNTYVHGEQG